MIIIIIILPTYFIITSILCYIDMFMFWAFVINFIILIIYDYIFIISVYTCPLIVASIRDFLSFLSNLLLSSFLSVSAFFSLGHCALS